MQKTSFMKSGRFLAVVLALAMLLCVSAFAAIDTGARSTITVDVEVQYWDNSTTPAGTPVSIGTKQVTVPSNSTVYDVVVYMSANANPQTQDEIAYDAIWKDVPSGAGTAKALVTMSNKETVSGFTTTNVWGSNSVMYTQGSTGLYEGTDWEYYVNTVYATDYMDQYVLSDGDDLLLSYTKNYFTW